MAKFTGKQNDPKYLKALKALRKMRTFERAYDGAASGRRTDGWTTQSTSSNTEIRRSLTWLRNRSRDLVRNNPYAERAVRVIANNTIGYGITTTPIAANKTRSKELNAAWKNWSESTECDADGMQTLYGLQNLAMRSICESGEVLVRRRWRRPEDGLSVPMQLQVIEPDFLDSTKDGRIDTGFIVQGVQFNKIGQRVGYWLYSDHPGDAFRAGFESKFVPAEDIAHVFRMDRPGQVRGVPWGAPCILRLRDFDEYEDAQLIRQKIAACFAVFYYDREGEGDSDDTIERVEPGIIEHLPPGSDVQIASPPGVDGYGEFASVSLHAVAAGYGITYESLTGNYNDVSYSSGRLGRLDFFANLDDWQYNMLIPRLCDRVGRWFLQAALLAGLPARGATLKHVPPRRAMTDPTKDVPATNAAIRAGLLTLPEAIRQQGYDVEEYLDEYALGIQMLDARGIALDSDPRWTSKAGVTQARPEGSTSPFDQLSDEA